MNKRLTSIDIARLAGVSQTTVSRVLQDLPSVRPETKARVLQVIREQGYLPSAAARQMKTRRSGTVAVVVASLSNPLYPWLLQLLVARLAAQGFRTTVWELQGPLDEPTVHALSESAVDGVVFATAVDDSLDLLARVAREKPVALINRQVSSNAFDTVISDNREGGRRVAAYFLSAGRRRIGLLSAQSAASTIREREEGFLAALRAQTPALEPLRAAQDPAAFTYESGYQAMTQMLQACPDLDSVFCTNDIVAIGALDAARRAGKRVPDDLWIVGYDDIPMARWESIGLSTVQQPLSEMVQVTVDRLVARMDDLDLPPEKVVLPNDLIVRGTTSRA